MDVSSYFNSQKILVLETDESYRQLIFQTLSDLGVRADAIFMSQTMEKANQLFQQFRPKILISEFQPRACEDSQPSALMRASFPNSTDRLILLTSRSSNKQDVIDAVHEEADALLLKPFDRKKLSEYLRRTAEKKQNPTEYELLGAEIKFDVATGRFDEAKRKLKTIMGIAPTSPQSYYFKGHIEAEKKDFVEAKGSFEQGLMFNPHHYKCLVGKLQSQVALKEISQACTTLKLIEKMFPLTTKLKHESRLLSIRSLQFERFDREDRWDLEKLQFSQRKELTAELFESAKVLLNQGRVKSSVNYFKTAAVVSKRDPDLIAKSIQTLLLFDHSEECKDFFEMLDSQHSPLIEQLRFQQLCRETHCEKTLIQKGRELIDKNVADEWIFRTVIDASARIGLRQTGEEVAFLAAKKFGKNQTDFLSQ